MSGRLPAPIPVDDAGARLEWLALCEWTVAVDAARTAATLLEGGWAVSDDDLAAYAAWLAGRVEEAARFGWGLALLVAEGGRDG